MQAEQQAFKTRMDPPQPSPVFARGGNTGTLSFLPTSFHAWLKSEKEIPNIRKTPLTEVYKILSMHLECLDYTFNLATFWYLDILSEALEVAQEEMNMNQKSQKSLLAWFAHIVGTLKSNKHWTREEAFGNLHITILAAGSRLSHVGWDLPVPQDLKTSSAFTSQPPVPRYAKYAVGAVAPSSSSLYERASSLTDMSSVVQLLYSVFANAFQFELIKAAFCTSPRISEHVIPHTIHFPKEYKPSPVIVKPSAAKRGTKEHKPKDKKHKKEPHSPTEEEQQVKELAAKLAKMEKERLLYILPLQDAITEEYIHRLFHIEKEHVKHVKEHAKHDREHEKHDKEDKNVAGQEGDDKKSKDKAGKKEKGGKKGKKK